MASLITFCFAFPFIVWFVSLNGHLFILPLHQSLNLFFPLHPLFFCHFKNGILCILWDHIYILFLPFLILVLILHIWLNIPNVHLQSHCQKFHIICWLDEDHPLVVSSRKSHGNSLSSFRCKLIFCDLNRDTVA